MDSVTTDTSGPSTFGSFASSVLQSSLENRLRALTASRGSTLFSLTWKVRVTPAQRPICALRGSVRRTSDNACTSWPSPTVNDSKGSAYSYANGDHERVCLKLVGAARLTSWPTPNVAGSERGGQEKRAGLRRSNLIDTVKLAAWPTPMSRDSDRTSEVMPRGNLTSVGAAKLASWATPASAEAGGTPERFLERKRECKSPIGISLTSLSLQAQMASWATPAARDHRSDRGVKTDMELYGSKGAPLPRQALQAAPGQTPDGSPVEIPVTASCSGQLNPDHSRWLQGFPAGWGSYADTATRSSRKSPARSSGR